jgi:hypothetical protein
MRMLKSSLLVLALALATVPVTAAIKAMTLSELMAITTDVAHVKITAKATFPLAHPFPEAVYTKLTVEGKSLRTGEAVKTDMIFLGSHDPDDQYGISEMPTLQDTRVGSEVIVFFERDKSFPGEANMLHNLGTVYRVEKTFGTPVVIGKGEGFAFPENVKLVDARNSVRETHLALQAAQSAVDGK